MIVADLRVCSLPGYEVPLLALEVESLRDLLETLAAGGGRTSEGIRTREALVVVRVRRIARAAARALGRARVPRGPRRAGGAAWESADQMRSARLRGGERAARGARRRGARGVSGSCVVDVVTRLRELPNDGSLPIVCWN